MAFGLLNIHKPLGPTSHDIVASVRRGTGIRRIGHAGTLDPMAEGVLVLALGQATRLVEYLTASEKSYLATVKLGTSTDSYDAEGTIISERPLPSGLSQESIEVALGRFRGDIMQIPPVYSAIKVAGKSAHARVRAGQAVSLPPRPITIYALELREFDPPSVTLFVRCSAGTYIRSLAHDLGEALGMGAMLNRLVRTASGSFHIDDSIRWPIINDAFQAGTWEAYLLSAERAVNGMPRITLDAESLSRVLNGMPILDPSALDSLAQAHTLQGMFVAVMRGDASAGLWRPIKVFTNRLD